MHVKLCAPAATLLVIALALIAPPANAASIYLPVALSSALMPAATPPAVAAPVPAPVAYPVVFVSRQIPVLGSVYWDVPGGMPGVGAFSRFQVAAPGRLMLRAPDGALSTLIDGSSPEPHSLNLVDVNAPDVNYAGDRIVFAGIPAGRSDTRPNRNHNAWRIYTVRPDGTELTQVTSAEPEFSATELGRFGGVGSVFANQGHDDTDPAWLPDDRIVFSSTRWPSFAQYSGVRATQLFVVNADGTGLHRLTAERSGADRPVVDPITGKVVFARWWRNHRVGTDRLDTEADPQGGFIRHLGLTSRPADAAGGRASGLVRNSWQLAAINPDGSELGLFTGFYRSEVDNHAYGGAFTPSGDFVANFFPMANMSEAAGFGGLRLFPRGGGAYVPLAGVTTLTLDYVNPTNPTSYGIFNGDYAAEPEVLPDGRMIASYAPDVTQDYGLVVLAPDGRGRQSLVDLPGTTELRAKLVRPRPRPPLPSGGGRPPEAAGLPPASGGPYDTFGTFEFLALNVYANGPVDMPIVNAPAVGSAAAIRFFADHQRTSSGSFPNLDWPELLAELPVAPDGSVPPSKAPAGLPLFEQLRAADGTIPLTQGPPRGGGPPLRTDGAAHVAGMNYGVPGSAQTCVGCHAGHTLIPVPVDYADAAFSNLAPGARVSVSSSRSPGTALGLIDRRVRLARDSSNWQADEHAGAGAWVDLTFPVPITVRRVTLHPVLEPAASADFGIERASVSLLDGRGNLVGQRVAGPVGRAPVDLVFASVRATTVRVELEAVTGSFMGAGSAALAEIEVVARGEAE